MQTDQAGTRRALHTAGMLCALLVFVEAVAPLLPAHAHDALLPGLVLVSASMGALFVAHVRHRASTRLLWASGVPLALGIVAMMPHRSLVQPTNLWAPGYWSLPWYALALLTLRRRDYMLLAVGLGSVTALLDLAVQALVGAPLTRAALEPVPGFLTPVLLLVGFGDALLQLSARRDRSRREREQATRAHAREQALAEDREEAARLVHDHLLHALHAVANTNHSVPVAQAASECRIAVDAMTSHRETLPRQQSLAALLSEDPALATVGATLSGTAPALPGHVAQAMASAAHEALNNIERHAHAQHAAVRLDHDGQQWSCTIHDDGVGFDPRRTPTARMGVRESIRGRLDAVGGQAVISSAPAAGTTVTLLWPAPEAPEPDPSADLAAHNATARAAWPSLLFAPVFTALLAPLAHPMWPTVLATLVLVGVGAFHILRLRRHALTRWDSASLLGTSLAVWAVNLWCAPPDVHDVNSLWLAWGCAALAHLVVLQASLRRGLVALAGWTTAMTGLLVVRYHRDVDWMNVNPVITVGISEAVVALVTFHQALRLAREAADENRLALAMARETTRLGARSQLDQHWSQRVTHEALPLLDFLADHPEAIDADTRRRTTLIEATLRDELLLGPEHPHLLGALRHLREQGWAVAAPITTPTPDGVQAATRLADRLGPPTRAQQGVTLTTCRDTAVAVVMAPGEHQLARWRALVDDLDAEDDFARLRMAAPAHPEATGLVT